jgi:hypothetical protein
VQSDLGTGDRMNIGEKSYNNRPGVPLIASCVMLAILMTGAGPIEALIQPHTDPTHAVHDAEHAVDYAWETYHRAALGGTIASPEIQQEVEDHLHESRGLLTKAWEAAERGDKKLVDKYLQDISGHLNAAVKGSTEKKK